jgi:hypothetical protein
MRSGRRKSIIMHIIAFAVAAIAVTGVIWMLMPEPECPVDDAQPAPPCPSPPSIGSDNNDSQNVKPR